MLSFRHLTSLLRHASHQMPHASSTLNEQVRATKLLLEYRARRHHYEGKWAPPPSDINAHTQERLRLRGVVPLPKAGPVRTLSYFPLVGWHKQLRTELDRLGSVTHFDLLEGGLDYDKLFRRDPDAIAQRDQQLIRFVEVARAQHAQEPFDWLFVYASGTDISPSALVALKSLKIPIVGMCLDDKQSWVGPLVGEARGGQIDIVPHLDLAWTSSSLACDWYYAEGSNPIFLGEGCETLERVPDVAEQPIDCCFVGQAYGFRKRMIRELADLGMQVECAGQGWPRGPIPYADMLTLMRSSKVILGMGGIGWSEGLKNVKGRDFEGPALGSSVYLTSFNPDLCEFFQIGKEIACYSTVDEAYELIRFFARNVEARRAVARAGFDRCQSEHTWKHRFETVLRVVGVRQ